MAETSVAVRMQRRTDQESFLDGDDARPQRPSNLRQRAAFLLNQEVRFIYASEFEQHEDDESPIEDAQGLLKRIASSRSVNHRQSDRSGEETLQSAWSASDPLLSFDDEQILFKALNLLRFRVNRLRARLSEDSPSERLVEEIEQKMDLIEQVRSQLVNSNLRLVSSIARKFASLPGEIDDFTSDGCMILLGAIDRFDFSKRFRFSTYATHSIQRHFFRTWKTRQRRKDRFPNTPPDLLGEIPQTDQDAPICSDPDAVVSSLLIQAEGLLEPREHQILMARFGLGGEQRSGKTLREIASDLNISKERVRQLQMKALEKLRDVLDVRGMPAFC